MTTKPAKITKQKPVQAKSPSPAQAKAPAPQPKTAFSKMSMAQLLEAEVALKNELTRRKREAKRGLMKEMQTKAKAAGLSMADLLGTGKQKPEVPVKYRNPDNPKETWGGLGKRPTWLKTALNAGKTLKDLAVGS